jgi:two-component system chemotaxis response regulator CheB
MAVRGQNVIVIGTSAGGLEVLDALVSELPTDLPSAIFIVQHLAHRRAAGTPARQRTAAANKV